MEVINLNKLYIFSINLDNDTFEYKISEVDYPCKVRYIEIGFKYFTDNILKNVDKFDFLDYNTYSLYILRGGYYCDIREMITEIGDNEVYIARGSSQKAHAVSPIDFRLSCYLLILCNMDYNKFTKINSFNYMNKNRYLPTKY